MALDELRYISFLSVLVRILNQMSGRPLQGGSGLL
jgi:hypothetical protein